jgi:hypothetical protein
MADKIFGPSILNGPMAGETVGHLLTKSSCYGRQKASALAEKNCRPFTIGIAARWPTEVRPAKGHRLLAGEE